MMLIMALEEVVRTSALTLLLEIGFACSNTSTVTNSLIVDSFLSSVNMLSDGGTMRFKQEATDPANAGLSIIRDMLHPVAAANPGVSSADLWTAGERNVLDIRAGDVDM
jgi:hypothetical protein